MFVLTKIKNYSLHFKSKSKRSFKINKMEPQNRKRKLEIDLKQSFFPASFLFEAKELNNEELKNFSEQIIEKIEADVPEKEGGVYIGEAGKALAFFQLFEMEMDENKKNEYLQLCVKHLKKAREVGFKKERRMSFLEGVAGLLSLEIAISKFRKCPSEFVDTRKEKISELLSVGKEEEKKSACNELLYGRTGFLYSLLFVLKYFPGEESVRKLSSEMVEKLVDNSLPFSHKGKPVLMYEWHGKKYLGGVNETPFFFRLFFPYNFPHLFFIFSWNFLMD